MARKQDENDEPDLPSRRDDLAKDEDIRKSLLDLYKDVERGFEDQNERSQELADLWDIYNCKLTGNQFYTGNAKIFVPIVQDAVRARVTRFSNQIFPKNGRYIDV